MIEYVKLLRDTEAFAHRNPIVINQAFLRNTYYTRSILRYVYVPSTTPQMKLPFFVFRFAAPFVSVIAACER